MEPEGEQSRAGLELDQDRTVFLRLREVLALPEGQREAAARTAPGLDAAQARRLLTLVRRDASERPEPMPASDGSYMRRLEPGLQLGEFKLVRRLDMGGQGQVWEAEQVLMGRRVALKLLHSGLVTDEASIRRLRMEARTAGRLQHPGIVTVHSAGEAEGLPYMAQELVADGRDLRRWIEERRSVGTPQDHAVTVARMMADAADAVQVAHAASVVHRDLTPRNIMLRADGRIVVIDFGLASLTGPGSGDVTQRLGGTPPYLAPEQLREKVAGKDPRTDVYQLGATLYELLTLRQAFEESDVAALTRRILAGDFPRPRSLVRGLPYTLEAICLKAMASEPSARYADAGTLCDDLRRFIDGRELPHAARGGPLVGALRRVPYWLRRHRIAAAAAGAVALGLMAGLLFFGGGEDLARVHGIKRAGKQAEPIPWENSEEASIGDLLGADLELRRPATVYALSAFGERSPPTWVVPLDVVTRDSWIAGMARARDPGDPWGRALPAGRYELVLSQLGESSANVGHEGFIVMVTESESPVVEAWFKGLDRAAAESKSAQSVGQEGVGFAQACELLETVRAGSRGGTPRLSEEQLAGLARMKAEDVLREADFEGDGVESWRVMWRVVK